MSNEPPHIYGLGDFWYDGPGCHHYRSENASLSERPTFYAILVVDDGVIERKGGEEFGKVVVLDWVRRLGRKGRVGE